MTDKANPAVAVIIPDASPVLTLAHIGRLDLLGIFTVPVRIVDQVHFEITNPENDPKGDVAAGLRRLHNQIEIVETKIGVDYQTRRASNPKEPSGNLSEIAVEEYATALAHSTPPGFVPLVLFEDPNVIKLRIARLRGVHLLNTTGWLLTLHGEGLLPGGLQLVDRINSSRVTPLVPFEKVAQPKRVRSSRLRRSFRTMNEDLKGSSLADVLEKLERGKLGHRAVMEWLEVKSYDDLVAVMHVNGRLMPGHRPMCVTPATRALARRISRPLRPLG